MRHTQRHTEAQHIQKDTCTHTSLNQLKPAILGGSIGGTCLSSFSFGSARREETGSGSDLYNAASASLRLSFSPVSPPAEPNVVIALSRSRRTPG